MPILIYFHTLLQLNVKLNKCETLELCKLILNKNKDELIKKLLNERLLDLSEELADLLRENDEFELALLVYTSEQVIEQHVLTSKISNNNNNNSSSMSFRSSNRSSRNNNNSNCSNLNSYSIGKYVSLVNRIIECNLRLQKFDSLIDYLNTIGYEIEHSVLIKELFRLNKNAPTKESCVEFAKILATRTITTTVAASNTETDQKEQQPG